MRRDAKIRNAAAAGELLPAVGNLDVDGADLGLLRYQRGVSRLPQLNCSSAVCHRIANKAGRSRIDHRELTGVGTELAREPVEHHKVRRALGCREILALKILQLL